MGLFSFGFKAILPSIGLSATRRLTGYNVNKMILSQITHPGLKSGVGMYLKTGDWIVDGSINQVKSLMSSGDKELKEFEEKQKKNGQSKN